ncbi:hypothetical protein LBMAG42_31310 [Deltaproteobacteria bacterium]|nr:hypothetical protein LBMAG42_31310 [Deltaproteobacteria bacterium]
MRLCLPLLLLIGCDDVAPVVCGDSAEPTAFYRDDDGDGFGLAERVRFACEAPVGFVSAPGDCRDDDPASFPGAPEQCDWWDNDCNGVIDDDVAEPTVWYADADGDGYGDPGNTTGACDVPAGFVADFSDCSDADAEIHPGADEYCDDVDQDCDGAPDDAESVDAPLWHEDADGDGFGDRFAGAAACANPGGLLEDASDCDDTDADIHPGATELCDTTDRDCDGDATANAADPLTWYADADLDGYGTRRATAEACTQPAGYSAIDGDCNDNAGAIHPGGIEFCDSVDHDCDGETMDDEAVDAVNWYVDGDLDGYGNPSAYTVACEQPAGFAATGDDCDETDGEIHPGAVEQCDGVDHDCDGAVDEDDSVDAVAWYLDADGDGFGDASAFLKMACPGSGPGPGVADACDCDDSRVRYNPDGLDCDTIVCSTGYEVWVDDACGLRDEGSAYVGTAAAPVEVVLDEPTTVTFCDGTWYVNLVANAATTLTSVNGAEVTTLDAAGGVGVLFGADLVVEGLALTGASASSRGSALSGVGDLVLRDAWVWGNAATGMTGSIVEVDGALDLDGATISANNASYSQAAPVVCSLSILTATGAVTAVDSAISDNTVACTATDAAAAAVVHGGALRAGGDVSLSGTVFSGNTVSSGETGGALGGAVYLESGSLSCADDGGFWGNVADSGGAVYWASPAAGATITSSGCDWGAGDEDNAPDDIAGAAAWSAGDDATFSCDSAGVCL